MEVINQGEDYLSWIVQPKKKKEKKEEEKDQKKEKKKEEEKKMMMMTKLHSLLTKLFLGRKEYCYAYKHDNFLGCKTK